MSASAKRFILRSLSALVVLVSGLIFLQRFDQHRDLETGVKLADIEGAAEPITLVMVGSSRTKFHIVPDVMDSTLAAHGWPSRSYNYGLLGTPATEISYVVDYLLDADLPGLETIVLELQPLPLRELKWHPLTRKGAYHFDATRVRLGLEATHASDLSGPEKRAAYARFLRLGIRHYLLAGQGTNALRSAGMGGRGVRKLNGERGFAPLLGERAAYEEQIRRIRARSAAVADSIEQREGLTATPVDSVLARHFAALERRAAEAGVEVAFIVQPMTGGVEGVASLLENGGSVVVRLNDPTDFSGLYQTSLWYDSSHLNEEGARRVTETAARELAEALSRADR